MKYTKHIAPLFLLAGIFIGGCKNDDPISAGDSSILYEDAAESISGALGTDTEGATANFADIMTVAGGGSFGTLAKSSGDHIVATPPEYDSVTGWWTVSISRSFENNLVQRSITREYRYQFLKNGAVQKNYISGSDTATILNFNIVSGTGYFKNPRIIHRLDSLRGAWRATNINRDTVTINSTEEYVRVGVDSIITRNMIRVFAHKLTMTFTDITAPRFRRFVDNYDNWRTNFHKAISGTVSGHYTANITFTRGDAYKERSIDKTFTITFGGGEGTITISGGGSFRCNMENGQRK